MAIMEPQYGQLESLGRRRSLPESRLNGLNMCCKLFKLHQQYLCETDTQIVTNCKQLAWSNPANPLEEEKLTSLTLSGLNLSKAIKAAPAYELNLK